MGSKEHLFDEFPPVQTRTWEERINKDLRTDDYKAKLQWETGEGISALPFYRQGDVQQDEQPLAAGGNEWEIRQLITEQDPARANEVARRAINGCADGLTFWLRTDLSGRLHGVNVQTQKDFSRLLKDIDLAQTSLHFDGGRASLVLLSMLHNVAPKEAAANISGNLLYDPYALFLQHGIFPDDAKEMSKILARLVSFGTESLPNVKVLGVDARLYHASGGAITQQLGYALATASEYLATLGETGVELQAVASNMHFNFSIGSNYFLEIAKLRALRRLWPNLLAAYNVDKSIPIYVHGSSSEWNKTRFDPYVNMLRTTTEGMSAAISSCDAITLLPFDATFRQPDDFSRRIARNIQIMLKEEAHFDKVADPAAGSYYVEILTDKMARSAWTCFKEVEQAGGMLQAIQEGIIQSQISKSAKEKDRAIAFRKRVFVGTNEYPNMVDSSLEERAKAPPVPLKSTDYSFEKDVNSFFPSLTKALREGAAIGDFLQAFQQQENIPRLATYRGAQAFEELRLATEHHLTTPEVCMLPVGDKKIRQARSAFAVNFLGCLGYNITNPIGFDSMDEAVAEIVDQQPDVVVLCSSDDEYKRWVPALCQELNQLEKRPIAVLAGYPKKQVEQYKEAGIEVFIHSQSNVLETLKYFQQRLGIIEI